MASAPIPLHASLPRGLFTPHYLTPSCCTASDAFTTPRRLRPFNPNYLLLGLRYRTFSLTAPLRHRCRHHTATSFIRDIFPVGAAPAPAGFNAGRAICRAVWTFPARLIGAYPPARFRRFNAALLKLPAARLLLGLLVYSVAWRCTCYAHTRFPPRATQHHYVCACCPSTFWLVPHSGSWCMVATFHAAANYRL